MDISVRQELSSLLEQLTHSGSASLNPQFTKKLRGICRSTDANVRTAYELLLTHLSKDHAEVRFSSFQVIEELFPRSHLFRELLISDFRKFASLVAGTDPRLPLPLPKPAADQLKEKSLLAIRKWNDKYGDGYPKLKLGYNYLKVNKKVNFDKLVAQTEAVRRRQEEREGRQRAILQQRIQEVKQEMKDLTCDVEDCMMQISSCFDLLMPRFDIPDIYTSQDVVPSTGEASSNSISQKAQVPDISMATVPSEISVSMAMSKDDKGRGHIIHHKESDDRIPDMRQRTVSSGSFASLTDSESGDTNTSVKDVHPDDVVQETVIDTDNTIVSLDRHSPSKATEEAAQDEVGNCNSDIDFLRMLYGVSSSSSSGHQNATKRIKKLEGKKGKSPLKHAGGLSGSTSRMSQNVHLDDVLVGVGDIEPSLLDEDFGSVPCGNVKESIKEGLQQVPEDRVNEERSLESDSDSEVEWEDVDPVLPTSPSSHPHTFTGSHDPLSSSNLMLSTEMDLQAHGIATHGFSIPIELSTVPVLRENEDNSSILATLRESKQLLVERYLNTINRWMEWLSKGSGEDDTLRAAIDLKQRVRNSLDKFDRIKIIYKEPSSSKRSADSQSTDSREADSVPVSKPQVTHPEWTIDSHSQVSIFDAELDPTTPRAQIARLRKRVSDTSSKTKATKDQSTSSHSKGDKTLPKDILLSKAPVVPFDMDLYYWENPSELKPMTMAPVGSLHRFWVQEREVDVSTDEQARLQCRTITYPGKFEPVQKICRAPLPSGKLCPRRDRLKCPLHGPVIPRDEKGSPVLKPLPSSLTPYLSSVSESGLTASGSADGGLWPLDPDLQEAIRDAKGTELLQAKKKRKARQPTKKHPGLTDLKLHTDTPRTRLEKKVLSRRALKRVADSVDSANAKKYKDKFGNNFNYALKN